MIKFIKNSSFSVAYSRFIPYVLPYKYIAILGLLLTAPVGALDAIVAWFLKPFMDNVMVEKQPEFTSYVPFIIVGFTIIQGTFIYLSEWVNGYVGGKITLDIRRDLYHKLLKMNSTYYDTNNSGSIIYRYFNDAELASTGLISNLKLFLTRAFSSIGLVCVLIYTSWQLSIIAIGVLLVLVLPLKIVRKKIKKITTKTVEESTSILTLYNETSSGYKIIKSYNLQNSMKDKFEFSANYLFKLGIKLIKETNWLSPVMHIVAAIGVAIVIMFGGKLIVTNTITSGDFVSFIAALIMLYTPLKAIGNNYINVQKSILAIDRIFEIFAINTVEEKESAKNLKTLNNFSNTIEFKNVEFSYDSTRKILNGISFTAKKGESIAFVGNSGGGKSTICALLPRLYEINSGEILIDDQNINNFSISSLRSQISYVFQDNFLFSGTLRDNIIMGNFNATEEDINKALKSACLSELVESLENGLDTFIGENGVLLSGGQKQRVAIARAFIKNAPIVILDEATSALDNKSELVVQEALENLMKDRTVFIIAHRLSTIRNATHILVVNDGVIVESGNHEQLLALNGAYANLYNSKQNSNKNASTQNKTI
ncbi:MAG: ABC transporter ATP-binding protein [Succinivibrionaceae bacterium]